MAELANAFATVSQAIVRPMFEYYGMGYNHAVQGFGAWSRANPEDREVWARNVVPGAPAPGPAPNSNGQGPQ